jgi:hypothetical protein
MRNRFPCDHCSGEHERLAMGDNGEMLCYSCLLRAMKSDDPMRSHYENKLRKSEQARRNFHHVTI